MTLIENAIKYHVSDDAIEVYWHGNKQTLSIENSCEAMTEDERKQLFERFYRRDTARNREQEAVVWAYRLLKRWRKQVTCIWTQHKKRQHELFLMSELAINN